MVDVRDDWAVTNLECRLQPTTREECVGRRRIGTRGGGVTGIRDAPRRMHPAGQVHTETEDKEKRHTGHGAQDTQHR